MINTSASHWLRESSKCLLDVEVHSLCVRSCEMVLRLSSVPSQSFAASCLLAVSIRSIEGKSQYHHTFPWFYSSKIWQCFIKFVWEIKSALENMIPKPDHLCQTVSMWKFIWYLINKCGSLCRKKTIKAFQNTNSKIKIFNIYFIHSINAANSCDYFNRCLVHYSPSYQKP